MSQKIIEIKELDQGRLSANSIYIPLLKNNGINTLNDLWHLKGESVKNKLKLRGTEKSILDSNGEKVETYVKRYLPLPLKEYFKGITSFRPFFPSGAIHEWKAIIAFHAVGIDTMDPIAVGRLDDGRSVLLSLGITDYERASDLLPRLGGSENRQKRRELIHAIADLAGRMHAAKFAHQDFYLVHLFVKTILPGEKEEQEKFKVLPIDLQRIIIGPRFSRRWRVKDLGQLLYSALDHTTASDRLFFWKHYTSIAGNSLQHDKKLLKAILRKASAIRKRSQRKQKKHATSSAHYENTPKKNIP